MVIPKVTGVPTAIEPGFTVGLVDLKSTLITSQKLIAKQLLLSLVSVMAFKESAQKLSPYSPISGFHGPQFGGLHLVATPKLTVVDWPGLIEGTLSFAPETVSPPTRPLTTLRLPRNGPFTVAVPIFLMVISKE